jgi:integrase
VNIPFENVMVKVYPAHVGEYKSWRVVWIESGDRKKKRFKTEQAAKDFALEKAKLLNAGYTKTITAADFAAIQRGRQLVAPTGKSVELVCSEYREMWDIVPDVTPKRLAEFYRSNFLAVKQASVKEVVEEYLTHKKRVGADATYRKNLKSQLMVFAEHFNCPLTLLTGQLIRNWILDLKHGTCTKNHYRTTLGNFLKFAKEEGYLPEVWNEFDKVKALASSEDEDNEPIEIWTREEMVKLLTVTPENFIPFMVLGAFAGLRTKELQTQDWKDINLDEGILHVSKAKRRTPSRRVVHLSPNLVEWLRNHAKKAGRVCPIKQTSNKLYRLSKAAGLKRRHNALRHSFISYHVALHKNPDGTALEAGNSREVIFKRYREVVSQAKAREWFAIMPADCGKAD